MSTWSHLLTLLWELGEAPRPIFAAASKQQGRKGTIFVANCLHRLLLEMWAWDKGLLPGDASLSHWFCCQMSCEFQTTDFWASCQPWQISANTCSVTLCVFCVLQAYDSLCKSCENQTACSHEFYVRPAPPPTPIKLSMQHMFNWHDAQRNDISCDWLRSQTSFWSHHRIRGTGLRRSMHSKRWLP